MSPASFRISLDAPEAPPPPPSKLVNPAALTREERHNNGWHVRFIAWVLGLPSILSIAFVGLVGLYYAFVTTGNTKTWLALSAGIVIVTLFTAGLPIGAALNRETEPAVAKAAFGFWIACIALNLAIMGNFAGYQAAPAIPAPAIMAPLPLDDDGETDGRIEELRGAIEDARVRTPDDARRLANIKSELASLETRRYGGPVSPATPVAPIQAPGLDLAAVALLTLIGAALGLLISASSLAAILTEKAATVRVEAEAAPAPRPAPSPMTAYHPGESADGFEAWAPQCVSRLQGGRIRPAEAHASYLAFCARNDYAAPLQLQEFGRRLRSWLADTYGLNGHHSNGTVYEGATLAPLAPSITAPAMNGAVV